jgi:hypothetical protein
MRNAINDRDLLIEYFKYVQEQTRVYESVTRSMNESHIQTISLLESYFNTTREAIQHLRPEPSTSISNESNRVRGPRNEILERTENIISDNSQNNVASLTDISSLITVLRENVRLLEEQNINRLGNRNISTLPNTRNRMLSTVLDPPLLSFASLNRRRPVPPVVTFSTVTNERVIRGGVDNNINNNNTPDETGGDITMDNTENYNRGFLSNPLNNEINNDSLNDNIRNNNTSNRTNIGSAFRNTIIPRERSTTTTESPYRRQPRPRSLVRRTINYFETSDPLISPGNLDSPVRVRPSRTQIRHGTVLLTAMADISGNNQSRCPIDLNDFVEGDSLLQIIGCGHVFREMNLRNHFRYSPTCPICRYDIRDYIPDTSDNDNNILNNVNINDNTMRV